MSEGFDIHKIKGGRVLVILHPACSISREAILALLAEMGVEKEFLIFLTPDQAVEHCAGTDISDVPVVIPLDEASCNAPELDAAGRQGGQSGGRVIVMFEEDFPYEGLHPIAEKYGTQCGWSADQLEDCVTNAKVEPRSSGGKATPRPKASQVNC